MSEGYNGWSNYETWKLALNIDNDEGLYNESRSRAWTPGELRDWLEEAFAFQDVGYKICDFWSFNEWKEIDFDEVADYLTEGYNEINRIETEKELV